MTVQKRVLTVHFQRSVGASPVEMEVAVNPLKEPSAPDLDATLVGGPQSQSFRLSSPGHTITFELVPTDHPDLTDRVTYRIAFREKYMGRQTTQDFVMPDFNVDFDDLEDLGNIIGGDTYVQWTDVGAPNGVAGLNADGDVVDANGDVVSGGDAAATVQTHLNAEITARQIGDTNVTNNLQSQLSTQISQVYTTVATNLAAAVGQLQNADTTERSQRIAAVSAVNASLTNLSNSTTAITDEIIETADALQAQVDDKADLIGGKIPSSQLPDVALGKAVPVDDEAAMLALSTSQVQPGDFAVRPDGVFFLNANPPSVLGNWVRFQVNATVFSVNGHTGAVTLSAADVGARSSSIQVPLNEVSGLNSALALKTETSVTSALDSRVGAIENDTTIVHTSAGLIAKAKMPADAAFITNSNLIAKKDGTVLDLTGGGTLDISDVTNLQTTLDAKRDEGVDIPVNEVTGLQTILTNNGLTSNSDLDGRVASAETRIEDLELGGGGGGGGAGASGKTVWFSSASPIDPVNTATDNILIRSPFGKKISDGTIYYNPAGVDPSEAVWPYLTPNGHLKFIKRNEAAGVDPALATQSSLDSLTTTVGTKASQSALDSLTTTVGLKATIASLNTTNDTVATKASQTALDSLSATVATKAAQTALDSLTTTVGTKAAASDLTTLAGRVTTAETTLSAKADTTTVNSALALKADASALAAKADTTTVNSALALKADASTTTTALAGKADLSGGKILSSQLPNLALNTVVSVASKTAMLALTTSQVQPGDIAVITATTDKGSYILSATDPTDFASWVKLQAPDDAVASVNGHTGTVVLAASDVGARATADPIAQSDVTGLAASLAAKADSAATTSALAVKTSVTDVQAILSASVANKQLVGYAASSPVASLAGQQSVDGTLLPIGTLVLLTAQASSVNNGVWTVASGSWTRPGDMANGAYFLKGSMVIVTNGNSHANSFWQETATSGIVGTNANNWVKVMTAGPQPTFTATNGVEKTGNDFHAKVVSGGGIQAVSGGLQLDPNVASRKYAGDVPAGSSIVTITHNLNSTDVIAQFRDKASGDAVLLGWKPTGVNTISAEFNAAPSSGQWRVTIVS